MAWRTWEQAEWRTRRAMITAYTLRPSPPHQSTTQIPPRVRAKEPRGAAGEGVSASFAMGNRRHGGRLAFYMGFKDGTGREMRGGR
jgi:hypothetical protein